MVGTFRIEGDTNWQRDSDRPTYHHEVTTVEPGRVETIIVGHGDGCAPVDPIIATHPEVVRYFHETDEARRVSAYRNRPVVSRFKPERKRKK